MDDRKPVDRLQNYLSDVDEAGSITSRAFDRAYISLRMQLLSGTLKPGQHLDINALAKAIGVSSSPVREALCTLVAERLLQSTKGSGFHVPVFDFAAMTDLLKWSDYLASYCAKAKEQPPDIRPCQQGNHLIHVLCLFRSIADMTANSEICYALKNAALRLHTLYRLESGLLPDAADEVAELVDTLFQRKPAFVRRVHIFHQRRIAILPQLVRVVREPN